MEWVDVRAEITWLGPPPFWLSPADGPRLRSALARLGFAIFEASPGAAPTETQFRRSVAEAMDLADYAWKNWDAFVDAFGELVRSTEKPVALIWSDPEDVFARDLEYGLRLYSMLAWIVGEWNRVGPECHQVVLFLQGDKHLPLAH
jgi:hypothetical protein